MKEQLAHKEMLESQLCNIFRLNSLSGELNLAAQRLILENDESAREEVMLLSNEYERLSNQIMECGALIQAENLKN